MDDGALEQGRRVRRGHEVDHGVSPGGLSEGRDPAGIAAEGSDIALHPAERLELVQQSEVGRPAGAGGQISEQAQAVGHRDDDDASLGHQGSGVEDCQVAGAGGVGPAVQPHHHRDLLIRGEVRRQGEGELLVVLTARKLAVTGAEDVIQERHRGLRARRGGRGGGEHSGPVRGPDRRLEPSGGGVRNARCAHNLPVPPSGDRAAGRAKAGRGGQKRGSHKRTFHGYLSQLPGTTRGQLRPMYGVRMGRR